MGFFFAEIGQYWHERRTMPLVISPSKGFFGGSTRLDNYTEFFFLTRWSGDPEEMADAEEEEEEEERWPTTKHDISCSGIQRVYSFFYSVLLIMSSIDYVKYQQYVF
ncbi:hypothetical protein O6H91_Y137100 [Diphasiastrum complanatum]|nr:hypothetical protein O6H91_Y137100 [Diphasiastrum complanatum]